MQTIRRFVVAGLISLILLATTAPGGASRTRGGDTGYTVPAHVLVVI